jgi:hypothetical protein
MKFWGKCLRTCDVNTINYSNVAARGPADRRDGHHMSGVANTWLKWPSHGWNDHHIGQMTITWLKWPSYRWDDGHSDDMISDAVAAEGRHRILRTSTQSRTMEMRSSTYCTATWIWRIVKVMWYSKSITSSGSPSIPCNQQCNSYLFVCWSYRPYGGATSPRKVGNSLTRTAWRRVPTFPQLRKPQSS